MEWPAQSPDLNPIEHAWQLLDLKLHASGVVKPTSESDMMEKLQAAWDKITGGFNNVIRARRARLLGLSTKWIKMQFFFI